MIMTSKDILKDIQESSLTNLVDEINDSRHHPAKSASVANENISTKLMCDLISRFERLENFIKDDYLIKKINGIKESKHIDSFPKINITPSAFNKKEIIEFIFNEKTKKFFDIIVTNSETKEIFLDTREDKEHK